MLDYEGYVVYSKDTTKIKPLGVVTERDECMAFVGHIPNRLKRAIVQIEDRRFYEHHGIDVQSVLRASVANMKAKKIVQGGSSITQQLARNMMRVNEKSLYRKVKEGLKAIELERHYTKEEILNLYFNNIYWGRNIRGIRAAALRYFGKEPKQLSYEESLVLLTILRGPNYYLNDSAKLTNRFNLVNKILLDTNILSSKRYNKHTTNSFTIQNNPLQIIRKNVIPFISEKIVEKDYSIISTINADTQKLVNQFLQSTKYPTSIIGIQKRKVIAFGSNYGTDYPFILKSNVGSTLKPFLYCFLRKKGVQNEKFNSYFNELDWSVREATQVDKYLNIKNALLHSNNNVFINACHNIGMDICLDHLSIVLCQDRSLFYPASILGATRSGISLYELAIAYYNYFNICVDEYKKECLAILNTNAKNKLRINIENIFLKTGTTNNNQERFAILGKPDAVFAILRNENISNDPEKEGSFLGEITKFASKVLNARKNYKWS